jgi:hypothetical protein
VTSSKWLQPAFHHVHMFTAELEGSNKKRTALRSDTFSMASELPFHCNTCQPVPQPTATKPEYVVDVRNIT